MAVYAIGDVQGCYEELQSLLASISFDPKQDTLWFTGDLVNRGRQSLAVLRFVQSLEDRAITVLGNHDLHLLAVVFAKTRLSRKDTFTDVLAAPDCFSLCHWLRQQPLLYHDAQLGFSLVHAGIAPQWRLSEAIQYANEVQHVLQSEQCPTFLANIYGTTARCWSEHLTGQERLNTIVNYFTRMRLVDQHGDLDFEHKSDYVPAHLIPWFNSPLRQDTRSAIIFGHWAALQGKTEVANVHALDTGCAWGNSLTALRLDDLQRFSVACDQYSE